MDDSSTIKNKQKKACVAKSNILDFILLLLKRWKLIIGVPFAFAVAAAVYSLSLPNLYTATAMVLPSQDDKGLSGALMGQLGGLAALAGSSMGMSSSADLYKSLMMSDAIKNKIVDKFNLMELLKAKYRVDAYRAIDERTKITLGKKDGIISIEVTDKDPKLSADIANTYVDELGRMAARLNMTGAGKNRSFYEERLASVKTNLAKAEENLKQFQSKNKAIAVDAQAQATIGSIANLRAKLAMLEIERSTMRSKFTDASNEVRTINVEITSTQAQLANLEGSGMKNSSILSAGNIPELGQEYMRLMREFKIQEALVELLTKQYEMSKMSEAKDVSPLNIIQLAVPPETKSKPYRTLMVLISGMTAFIASLVLVFILEFAENMSAEDKAKLVQIRSQFLFRRTKV